MSIGNIQISQLNNIGSINSNDFFPLVQSASMTTYRASIATIAPLITASLYSTYSISSSYSSASTSASYALKSLSASYSSMSQFCVTASYFNFSLPNSIPPFASASLSSSWASSSLSASYASMSQFCVTASYVNFSLPNSIPPFASASLSSSWASSSLSSSYTLSASYANTSSFASTASYTSPSSNFIKAFGTFYWDNTNIGHVKVRNNYNFYSASYLGNVSQLGAPGSESYGPLQSWILYMSTPTPTLNYTVITGMGGEPGYEYLGVTNSPFSPRSLNAFTVSMNSFGNGGFNDDPTGYDWFSVMVLHP